MGLFASDIFADSNVVLCIVVVVLYCAFTVHQAAVDEQVGDAEASSQKYVRSGVRVCIVTSTIDFDWCFLI